jgi:hypothetical protein
VGEDGSSWVVWDLQSDLPVPVSVHPMTPDGHADALRRFYELESMARTSFVRRRGAGWIALNVVIGLVFGFGLLLVEATLLVALGVDEKTVTRSTDVVLGASFLFQFVAGITGWLLFCYLRTARARRLGLAITYTGSTIVGALLVASVAG